MKSNSLTNFFKTLSNQPPTRFLAAGIGVLVVIIGILGIYKINAQKSEFKTVYNPEKAKEVGKSLKEIVGKIYAVPNEEPTAATVTDPAVLPQDPFYQKAISGDKILVFESARKAIMYRPSENKVIDVAELAVPQTPTPIKEVAGSNIVASTSAEPTSKIIKKENITPTNTIRVNFKAVTPTPINGQ